jgi:hypothetical protein
MTRTEATERIAATLRTRDDLLNRLAGQIVGMLEDEYWYEIADDISVATFGERVECSYCEWMVLPGFDYWSCDATWVDGQLTFGC